MEEMMCFSCKRSRTGINPKKIEEIDNNCELPSILSALELDENRVYCPHYSINEKVCIREVELLSEVSNDIKDAYPDGKCPDCFEPIPDHITDGDKCQNCGHIFHRLEIENSKRIEEMRDDGYQQREKGWSKGTGL